MVQPIKNQKVARLLQKTLGEIFVQEAPRLLDNMVVTVTEVGISPDLELAKVYLSFILEKDKTSILAKVVQQEGTFRKMLGNRVGKKLRKVPALQFYIDDTAAHAIRMHRLLDTLSIPECTEK
mmetsp:Transcript_10268/g.23714  ORF Transcript_10268/g.23714 Transcript_10268/m.23714 type:complete len:123 (+) Transcript_10268:1767-2135(+)